MRNRAWIERDVPLARCPLAACRRQGSCRYPTAENPCRRRHMTMDAMRIELAQRLERLTAEKRAQDPEGRSAVAPGSIAHERRLAYLKQRLSEADDAQAAREMAAREVAAARRPGGAKARRRRRLTP